MAQWQRCLLQQLVNLGSDPGTHRKVRDPTDATKLPPDFCTHAVVPIPPPTLNTRMLIKAKAQ